MKAGSTTLMDYLVSHHEVGIPDEEINYFDKDLNYNKGVGWYSDWFKNYASKKIIGKKPRHIVMNQKQQSAFMSKILI